MQKLKIGFIGIGVMGKSMADNLLKAGYEVMVYTRTKQKAESLLAKGAKWFDSAKALAQNVDIIISMVGYPQDVAEIYLGENGVIKNLKPQSIIIDMTTSSPKLAQEIYQEAQKYEIKSLDAPVSGGDVGAKMVHLPLWSVAIKKFMKKFCRFLKLWERLFAILAKQVLVNMQK